MKSFTIIIIFLITSFISIAQQGKIEGKVIDSKSGQPLAGVSVVVKGSTKGVTTDIDGHYILNADAAKKITLVFSYNGSIKEIEGIEVSENKITVQDVVIE